MNDVQNFALAFGAFASGLVVVAAWLFRCSAASLAVKLALPTLMLIGALAAAWQAALLFGRPAPTTLDRLPERIDLIAFRTLPGETRVDLWIAETCGTRAYEIPLDGVTRNALRQAKAALAEGRPATLVKRRAARPATGRAADRQDADRQGYELDPIQPTLPPKE